MISETYTSGDRTIAQILHLQPLGGPNSTSHLLEQSIAYFCPACGEIWGRITLSTATYWQCLERPCQTHGDGSLVERNIWASHNPSYYLTRDLMEYEILL